jgi:iron complex outermembrane receptor protein
MGYNDLSEKMDFRITGQLSWSNKAKTAGLLVSGAYTGRKPFQDGFGTVRWTQPKLDGSFGGNNTTLSNDTLNSLWFPRLPRQDSFHWEQERLGIASALEFRPNDKLDVNVSWLYSHFQSDSDSYNSFAEFRTSKPWGFSTITANSVTIDDTGKVALAGNFDNVGLRTESRLMKDTTNFNHVVANLKYDVSDNFKISGMVGYAKSAFFGDYFRTNIETKTDKGSNFSYDFTENSDIAKINYALDVTNPDNFVVLSNENFLNNYVDRTNKTARFDLAWTLDSDKKHTVRIGGIYNNREVDSRDFREDKNPPDVPLSSITRVYSYVDVGNYGGETELDFLVMDHEKGKAAYNYGSNMELNKGVGRSTWTVTEKTAGVYADYNLNTKVSDHGLRANLGARYVNTKAEVLGYLSSTIPLNEDNSYGNLLPSVNIAFDATEKLVLRAGASRSMTRPGLSSLVPIKQYSDVNFTVSGGNSQLDPLKADALDLSAEYYFTDKSVLAVGYFYKNIKSFIASSRSESVLREEDIAALPLVYPEQPGLLDPTKIWTYNTTTNVDGTKLSGIEVAYQQAFTFLPGALKNLGFAGNYSYVNAETETTRGGQIVKVPLTDLSKNSWNATLYYEVPKFGVRVSVNSRDSYVTNNQGGNGNVSENTSGMTQVDMSAFYHINDMFTLALEGINLNDAFERLYVTGDGTLDLYREGSYSGRQLFLGLRANF